MGPAPVAPRDPPPRQVSDPEGCLGDRVHRATGERGERAGAARRVATPPSPAKTWDPLDWQEAWGEVTNTVFVLLTGKTSRGNKRGV